MATDDPRAALAEAYRKRHAVLRDEAEEWAEEVTNLAAERGVRLVTEPDVIAAYRHVALQVRPPVGDSRKWGEALWDALSGEVTE